ncbi:MAG: hypothetical protein IJC32_04880 [Clostridia bacterium]|nr:hypothetical protein [Clostridia bacterium]
MIVTFAGHGDVQIGEELKNKIVSAIKDNAKDQLFFYCGGYGAFDNACSRIAKELSNENPNIKLIFVTPYVDDKRLADTSLRGLYDEVIYPDLEKIPRRFAILKRNEYMVDMADLVIAYVNFKQGGAYKTLMYAKRKGKKIINLGDVHL